MTPHALKAALALAAGVVFIAQIALIPLKSKRIMKRMGNLVMPLDNEAPLRTALVFVVSALVIAAVPLRDFAVWISAVLLLSALLGEHLAAREACGLGKAGIYENGIVSGTNAIFFDEIFSFPTFAYEDDPDTVMVDFQTIEVMKKDRSSATLIFRSEEKRRSAAEKIIELRPEFKQQASDELL